MKRLLALATLATLVACDLLPGGGGGGGGGGDVTFTRGFTYTRKDDRNVYVADESDYQTVASLTQSANVRTPSLSADGRRIVFVRGTGAEAELATVATSGGTVTTVLVSTAQAKNFKTPVYSPDGQRIAFAFDEGTTSSIGLIDVAGTNFTRVAGGSALSYGSPSFTPDGKALIAAAGSAGLGFTQVERLDLATGLATSVTNTLGVEAMAIANRLVVSPDGTKAIFDGRVGSGVTRIFVLDLTARTVTKVNEYTAEPGTNDSFPCWVDAQTVAYSSDSGGNDSVYRISLAGTGRELLLPKAIEPWYGP